MSRRKIKDAAALEFSLALGVRDQLDWFFPSTDSEEGVARLARRIAYEFKAYDPGFDTDAFYETAGLDSEGNAPFTRAGGSPDV